MCLECDKKDKQIETLQGIYSGLIEQWSPMSNDPWEYSEPMAMGGKQGIYTLRSPFNAPSCQWKVDVIADGTNAFTALISTNRLTDVSIVPGIVIGDIPTTELGPINGLLLFCAGNGLPPVSSSWYNLPGGNQIIYMALKTTAAAYVNIAFRVKR